MKRNDMKILTIVLLVLFQTSLNAEQITTLFNTGVGDNNRTLHDNDVDPHYKLIKPSIMTGDAIVFTREGGYSIGGWLEDSFESTWISPTQNTQAPGHDNRLLPNYFYRTTFDLTGYDRNTVYIGGKWATDNMGLDIVLNGISTYKQTDEMELSYGLFHGKPRLS